MSTVSLNVAAVASITLTTTSITNTSMRASTAVDNSTNLYVDALVSGSIQAGTTPTANTTFELRAYALVNTGAYTGGASGTDGAYTDTDRYDEMPLLGVVTVNSATSNVDYVWGPFSVAAAFGGTMPAAWGVLFKNNSGVTTNATGTNNICKYYGIKYTVA